MVPSMETGTINVSQKFGIAAYRGRMVVEVLTCVNNLQSRCDMIEDATAILGCAACCAGIEGASNGSLLENRLQENHTYSDALTRPVSGQTFFDKSESSQYDSIPFSTPSAIGQKLPSESYAKRLRKRPAGSPEEENPTKKGKLIHTESITSDTQVPVTILKTGINNSGQLQGDKEKIKTARPRKGKDALIVGKSEEQNLLSKAPQQSVVDEGIDVETAALEWKQCVSLLTNYGIIKTPSVLSTEALHPCVPHPGYVGDGLLSKMCKTCGTIEDTNSTVICDDCQEAFHLSCCVPRMTSKYFKREDNWFCSSCRKQKKKMRSKLMEKGSSQEENSSKGIVKARLGPAHQADVPEWQDRAQDDDLERRIVGCIGMEIPFSQEQKDAERDNLSKTFKDKVESLNWLPAEKVPNGTPQNWVKCNNVIVRACKDSDGKKQNQIVCGKWRRAPLNVEQADEWECFCAMEWDPLHADCAVPQECSDEEVLNRMSNRMQANTDGQTSEVGSRKSTLRPGKFAL
eukprot:c10140_g1_i1 orf=394-1941(-)